MSQIFLGYKISKLEYTTCNTSLWVHKGYIFVPVTDWGFLNIFKNILTSSLWCFFGIVITN